jgi:L-alanine-DL-glutamate epimerase-like enolase superfamily enzyme
LQSYTSPLLLKDIIAELDLITANNTAAKASVDIALHDLIGKIENKPLHQIWNLNPNDTPYTTFTIGIGEAELLQQKIVEASEYPLLKIKLGGTNADKSLIDKIRSITDKPLLVDINQGWKDKYYALDMIGWLKQKKVIVVEQPLPKANLDDMLWLKSRSVLPLIADEAVQRLTDMDTIKHAYDGINIKLMKCTGLYEARKMITAARNNNLKIMLGCMSESSCGVSAAAQLSPLVDWADLDGPLLIKNDYFQGITFKAGKIHLSNLPGIGVIPKQTHN